MPQTLCYGFFNFSKTEAPKDASNWVGGGGGGGGGGGESY